MKYELSAERVIPHGLDEFEARFEEMMRSDASGLPVVMDATSPVPPGVLAMRAKRHHWIDLYFPSDGSGDGQLRAEAVGPQETRLRLTMNMHIGLGMWIVLKLFGKRLGADKMAETAIEELADNFPDALLGHPERK